MTVEIFGNLDLKGNRIVGGAAGVAGTDLATVDQVLQLRNQTDQKDAVRVASTGVNLTLSGLQTIDGVALAAGDRVLVKDQTDAKTNGIYVAATGAWARATDVDASTEVTFGLSVAVVSGTTKGTGFTITAAVNWILATPDPVTIGTTPLTFQVQGGTGSAVSYDNGIDLTDTSVNLDLAPTSGLRFVSGKLSLNENILQLVPDPLSAWKTAVNRLDATWLALGTGFTEGQGSTSLTSRWVQQVFDSARISRDLSVGRGSYFVPPQYSVTGVSAWKTSATSSSGTIAYNDATCKSPGLRGAKLTTPAQMLFTVVGTSIDIWHTKGTDVGSFVYNIDDTTNITVNMNQATSETAFKTRVSLGSSGTHTVKIQMSSGIMYFGGLTVWDADEVQGMRFVDASSSNLTASNLFSNVSTVLSANPDLITIEMGSAINDVNTVITNLSNFITQVRMQYSKFVSIAVILPNMAAVTNGSAFMAALRSFVSANKTIVLFDISAIGYGVSSDLFTPNDSGHTLVARAIKSYLSFATPQSYVDFKVSTATPPSAIEYRMVGSRIGQIVETRPDGTKTVGTCNYTADRLMSIVFVNPARTVTFMYTTAGHPTGYTGS